MKNQSGFTDRTASLWPTESWLDLQAWLSKEITLTVSSRVFVQSTCFSSVGLHARKSTGIVFPLNNLGSFELFVMFGLMRFGYLLKKSCRCFFCLRSISWNGLLSSPFALCLSFLLPEENLLQAKHQSPNLKLRTIPDGNAACTVLSQHQPRYPGPSWGITIISTTEPKAWLSFFTSENHQKIHMVC